MAQVTGPILDSTNVTLGTARSTRGDVEIVGQHVTFGTAPARESLTLRKISREARASGSSTLAALHPFRRPCDDRDHAAAPSGLARSIRLRSRGLFIASHRSLRR
jgi:hypothetical protein